MLGFCRSIVTISGPYQNLASPLAQVPQVPADSRFVDAASSVPVPPPAKLPMVGRPMLTRLNICQPLLFQFSFVSTLARVQTSFLRFFRDSHSDFDISFQISRADIFGERRKFNVCEEEVQCGGSIMGKAPRGKSMPRGSLNCESIEGNVRVNGWLCHAHSRMKSSRICVLGPRDSSYRLSRRKPGSIPAAHY